MLDKVSTSNMNQNILCKFSSDIEGETFGKVGFHGFSAGG
jgi:hypothetical protein